MSQFLWDDFDAQESSKSEKPASKRTSKKTKLKEFQSGDLSSVSPKGSRSSPIDLSGQDSIELPGASLDNPLSISALNAWISEAIRINLPTVWVEGEIGDVTSPRSGHVYLTLKDDLSQVRAVVWRSVASRLPFQVENGQSIVCFGRIEVYSPRGSYQLILERIEPKGLGSLQLAFQQLHQRLSSEGLFDADRKKELPAFPLRIGLVTSPSGAAVRDFLEAMRDRWPLTEVLVIPVKVQGDGAAEEIAEGIGKAQLVSPTLDVLVIGRGGGSTEDLWCFNEEPVVRAIAACTIPTVSAVGHEIDVTLSDLVADQRALTPTQAAHLVVPDKDSIVQILSSVDRRLTQWIQEVIQYAEVRLDGLAQRPVLRTPETMLEVYTQMIDELGGEIDRSFDATLEEIESQLNLLQTQLVALNPMAVLGRGFSITRDQESGAVIRSVESVAPGQSISTTFANGSVLSTVVQLENQRANDWTDG